ncbi:hypothetical protein AUI51_01890 [archaeon 13_1_40CM_2_52_4]|nr:MAG: hypothetical protein AUI51_01890 [archaeon 13_1_40CM_2_52_4]
MELWRTCDRFDVRFPVDEGYYMQKIIGFPNIDFQMLLGPTGPRKKSASSPPQNSQSFFEIIEGPNQILPELLNNV